MFLLLLPSPLSLSLVMIDGGSPPLGTGDTAQVPQRLQWTRRVHRGVVPLQSRWAIARCAHGSTARAWLSLASQSIRRSAHDPLSLSHEGRSESKGVRMGFVCLVLLAVCYLHSLTAILAPRLSLRSLRVGLLPVVGPRRQPCPA